MNSTPNECNSGGDCIKVWVSQWSWLEHYDSSSQMCVQLGIATWLPIFTCILRWLKTMMMNLKLSGTTSIHYPNISSGC
jgi:hypothetical protein